MDFLYLIFNRQLREKMKLINNDALNIHLQVLRKIHVFISLWYDQRRMSGYYVNFVQHFKNCILFKVTAPFHIAVSFL